MAEERVRRRRRRRRGRGGGGPDGVAPAEREASAQPGPANWQWRTFPVFFAFVSGALLILLIGPQPNTGLYAVLFFALLGATAFGLAHMVTRWLVRWRGR